MKKTIMLKKNYEFKKVLSRGKCYRTGNIEIFVFKNNSLKNFLGLAISTKVGHAVERNRIKRLIRENYKNYENNLKNGYTIVFLVRNGINTKKINFNVLKKDIGFLLNKADLLEKE